MATWCEKKYNNGLFRNKNNLLMLRKGLYLLRKDVDLEYGQLQHAWFKNIYTRTDSPAYGKYYISDASVSATSGTGGGDTLLFRLTEKYDAYWSPSWPEYEKIFDFNDYGPNSSYKSINIEGRTPAVGGEYSGSGDLKYTLLQMCGNGNFNPNNQWNSIFSNTGVGGSAAFSFWFKSQQNSTDDQHIFNVKGGTMGLMQKASDNKIYFNSSVTGSVDLGLTNDNSWHNFIFTHNGNEEYMKLVLDNEVVHTQDASASTYGVEYITTELTNSLLFGASRLYDYTPPPYNAYYTAAIGSWPGFLFSWRLYNRHLNSEERLAIWECKI